MTVILDEIMQDFFQSDFFAGNRERLTQMFTGTAPIVVTANALVQRGGDEPMPFYQDRSFWYLTGVDEPGVVLVMDKGREYLIVPGRETVREQFDGTVDFDEVARRSGVKQVYNEKEGWHHLNAKLKKVKHVATLAAAPKYIDFYDMYTNPARAELIQKLKDVNEGVELLDLRPHLSRMRTVKQEPEMAALQRAIDITIATLKEVTRPSRLAKYAYEYEIEAEITRGFRRQGALGHAFAPIVASGKRACTIHHIANDGQLSSDELLMLDVGADCEHYAADITRSLSLNGRPSRRQQAVHQAVLEVQNYASSQLKPGVLLKDYEQAVESFMGEKLRELGLIKSIERDAVRTFFPHRTSHFLGLDTHDAGDYEQPLKTGTVLTIEPGIYVPDEGIGVRIEDDVVITDDGVKVLTDSLPRELG